MTLLAAGFSDPVHDAQGCFRAVLTAMSEPGTVTALPATPERPAGLDAATAAVCLTLLDGDTPLWLSDRAVGPWLAFHCGCPLVEAPEDAAFALILAPAALPALDRFDWGSDVAPEAGATLILQVAGLEAAGRGLRGPGIRDMARLEAGGVPERFWEERGQMVAAYPRGLDIILTCGDRVAALPRTTIVEA